MSDTSKNPPHPPNEGNLNPIQINLVQHDENCVRIEFSQATEFVVLDADGALLIAMALHELAMKLIDPNRTVTSH